MNDSAYLRERKKEEEGKKENEGKTLSFHLISVKAQRYNEKRKTDFDFLHGTNSGD